MSLPEVDKIWMDGELVDWADAKVHVLTHALHYGSGVFEGIRCYETPSGPAVFRLTDHVARLFRGAGIMRMEIPFSPEEIAEAIKETIRINNLPSCYIRPLVFRGYGVMGLNPFPAPVQVIIAVWPWDTYLGEAALEAGVDIGISSFRQRGINSVPPDVKATGNYVNSSYAKMEAIDHGYEEAILLNEEGHVCEGTGENIFVMRRGTMLTPPLSDGLLDGITRDSVITLARDKGYQVIERSLVRTDLYQAEEIFMTGTAAELCPVRSVDHRPIPCMGPITRDLQKSFFDIIKGKDPAYEAWLDRV